MEAYKKDDRGRSKARRLTQADPHTKVDSSTWTPPEAENAGVKTGARPLVKRLYKKGGKVVGKHEGKESLKHAGRKPRKSGGRASHKAPWVDDLINRDVRMANDEREGTKHVGAFKKGGKIHKLGGGTIGDNPVSIADRSMAKAAGVPLKKGGKVHRKVGGGIEEGYRPTTRDPNYRGVDYSESDKDAVSNLAKYGSIRGNPTASPDYPERKRGGKTEKWIQGAIKHPGSLHKALHVPKGEKIPEKKLHAAEKKGGKLAKKAHLAETLKHMHHAKGGKATRHPDEAEDKKLMHKVLKPAAFKAKGGSAMHHEDCTCKMCGGGRAMKYAGGGTFSGDSKKKIPGDTGGRQARATGGASIRSQFNDAFRAARAAGDDTFEFNGKMYNTKLAAPAPKASGSNYMQPNAAYRPGQIQSSELAPPAPTEMSADQQRGMMGRQPQMSTQYGLFQGGGNRPAMTFSRDVPDANAKPVYHMPETTSDEQAISDIQAGRWGDAHGGPVRGRHAKGGRTKGKTNVNIIIGAGHGQPQLPMGMPNAPVAPPMGPPQGGMPPMPPMPPQSMPPQGMPPGAFKKGGRIAKFAGGAMAPMGRPNMGGGMSGAGMGGMNVPMGLGTPMGGGMGGAGMGGRGVPMGLGTPTNNPTGGAGIGTALTGGPNPMMGGAMGGISPTGSRAFQQGYGFASGGRTDYPIETGSGGGEARLDKIKAYGLTPPKRK